MTYHSPSHPFPECGVNILPKIRKSRRSTSANTSFGIKASDLDFQTATKKGDVIPLLDESTQILFDSISSQMERLFKEHLTIFDEKIDRLQTNGILKKSFANSTTGEKNPKKRKEPSL